MIPLEALEFKHLNVFMDEFWNVIFIRSRVTLIIIYSVGKMSVKWNVICIRSRVTFIIIYSVGKMSVKWNVILLCSVTSLSPQDVHMCNDRHFIRMFHSFEIQ